MKISCMCTFKMSRCFYHTKFSKRLTIVKKVVFGRKLGYQGVILAVCPPGCLLYVTDCSTNCRFLVDRGLAFSIMPCQSVELSSWPSVSGADGCRIPCWSKRPFTFNIDGVLRLWSFLLTAISFPTLAPASCSTTPCWWMWQLSGCFQGLLQSLLSPPVPQ
jgi:hypothetical protein